MNVIRTVDNGIRTVNRITDKDEDVIDNVAEISRDTAVNSYRFIRKVGKSGEMLHSSFSHMNTDPKENPAKKKFVADYAKKAYKRMENVVRRMKNFLVSSVKSVKMALSGTKVMFTSLMAGGSIAVMMIVLVSLVSLVAGSSYGIFFAGENTGGMSIRSVINELNNEFDAKIEGIKEISHDELKMSGDRAQWSEILSVYSVLVTTGDEYSEDAVTMTDEKKELLEKIFWEMNDVSHKIAYETDTVIEITDDGHGNKVESSSTVRRKILNITISHKSAKEMAEKYRFSPEQKAQMTELLSEENGLLWSAVMYGFNSADDSIVSVALSQVGNVGGRPYWSWYGFRGRVEWCACFVSWCANECGYIEAGIFPKFDNCGTGETWFKKRGQWLDGSATPAPGMIIFFDWASDGLDGNVDHVGIVEKVENGRVHTVEGNWADKVVRNSYPVGHREIYGYGVASSN